MAFANCCYVVARANGAIGPRGDDGQVEVYWASAAVQTCPFFRLLRRINSHSQSTEKLSSELDCTSAVDGVIPRVDNEISLWVCFS